MNKPALEAIGISKKFVLGRRSSSLKDRLTGFSQPNKEEFWAFRDVSIDVEQGSMLGVIGRNGSGKSTFLRTLCGVYRPTEGQVRVRGRVTALLELGAGFHQELTGRENVYMNGSIVGLGREHMDSVMDEIVDMADIGSFIDAPIATYSSGMRSRLGFAVSVQLQPEILLADEITAVGDIAFKEHGARRMRELRDQGTTIVQVTHNLQMVEKSCNVALWLHHGQVRRIGDPKEIVAEYKAAAETDTSGRQIGVRPAERSVEERRERQATHRRQKRAAVTESLAATDTNSDWFERFEFTDGDGGDPTPGGAATATIGIRSGEPISKPSVQLRILAAGGAATGFGYESGDLHDAFDDTGTGTLVAHVDPLTLSSGQYNLRVNLLSGPDVVASKTTGIQIARATNEDHVAVLPATWRVTAAR